MRGRGFDLRNIGQIGEILAAAGRTRSSRNRAASKILRRRNSGSVSLLKMRETIQAMISTIGLLLSLYVHSDPAL